MTEENEIIPKRLGIYLLPNLITTVALFAGFYAIIAAMKGLYPTAAISIFVAMIADSLDGRIARLTNTQTAFGIQYDSLSDMVSSGIAPAVLIYSWALHSAGKLGWLATFLYAAATALRLARFNVQAGNADKRFFRGLPCPAAAAVLAALVWFASEHHVHGSKLMIVAIVICIWLAVLMVSSVRFYSFKQLDFKGKVPFVTILLVVLLFAAVAFDPAQNLFIIFFLFSVSGPIYTFWKYRHHRRMRREKHRNEAEVAQLKADKKDQDQTDDV